MRIAKRSDKLAERDEVGWATIAICAVRVAPTFSEYLGRNLVAIVFKLDDVKSRWATEGAEPLRKTTEIQDCGVRATTVHRFERSRALGNAA